MSKYCQSDKNYGLNYGNKKHTVFKMVHDKKTGEEKLIKADTIDIEEQMEEIKLTVEAYNEIIKEQMENRKAENLIDLQNDEEFMKELEEASNTMQDENIYTIMDNFQTINKIFNNLPKEEKENFKTPQEFVKTGLKNFIKKTNEEKMKFTEQLKKQEQKVEEPSKIKMLEEEINKLKKGVLNNNEGK